MFKVKHRLCPKITSDNFMERIYQYNLVNRPDFLTRQVQSVFNGTESISYLGLQIWDIASEEFKH